MRAARLRRYKTSLRSVLVIRYSALGDVVLATSVLEPLRARFPDARIEWVTSPAYAPLLEGLPGLARVHRLGRGGLREAVELAVKLRGRFDLAIDLQNKVKSAIVARAAGRRQLVFRRRTPGQSALALLGVDPPVRGPGATQLYADVLRPLGVDRPGRIQVALPGDARDAAAAALAGARRPRVAVAPGASQATKLWAPERFAAVADALAARGASIVLAGGPADEAALAGFRAACRAPIERRSHPSPGRGARGWPRSGRPARGLRLRSGAPGHRGRDAGAGGVRPDLPRALGTAPAREGRDPPHRLRPVLQPRRSPLPQGAPPLHDGTGRVHRGRRRCGDAVARRSPGSTGPRG